MLLVLGQNNTWAFITPYYSGALLGNLDHHVILLIRCTILNICSSMFWLKSLRDGYSHMTTMSDLTWEWYQEQELPELLIIYTKEVLTLLLDFSFLSSLKICLLSVFFCLFWWMWDFVIQLPMNKTSFVYKMYNDHSTPPGYIFSSCAKHMHVFLLNWKINKTRVYVNCIQIISFLDTTDFFFRCNARALS